MSLADDMRIEAERRRSNVEAVEVSLRTSRTAIRWGWKFLRSQPVVPKEVKDA